MELHIRISEENRREIDEMKVAERIFSCRKKRRTSFGDFIVALIADDKDALIAVKRARRLRASKATLEEEDGY